jgi:hypothetical protein
MDERAPDSRANVEGASWRLRVHRWIDAAILVGGIVLLGIELLAFDRLVAWFDRGLALGIVVATFLAVPMTLAMRFVVTADRRAKDRRTLGERHRAGWLSHTPGSRARRHR